MNINSQGKLKFARTYTEAPGPLHTHCAGVFSRLGQVYIYTPPTNYISKTSTHTHIYMFYAILDAVRELLLYCSVDAITSEIHTISSCRTLLRAARELLHSNPPYIPFFHLLFSLSRRLFHFFHSYFPCNILSRERELRATLTMMHDDYFFSKRCPRRKCGKIEVGSIFLEFP